jgi:tRNA threonylcarbamoyladenosine biosynthesis protein TsaB
MIICLDTSTPTCRFWTITDESLRSYEWEADRQLADGLIGFMRNSIQDSGGSWHDVSGIITYEGPGSFTGLRIGLTVVNTIADTLSVSIVGETGDDWLETGRKKLQSGKNDRLVMPLYGREPNITQPRK